MIQGTLREYHRHWLNIRPAYAWGRWMLENFPFFVGYGIVRGVTEIAYHTSPRFRSGIEANVRHVLRATRSGISEAELQRLVRATVHRIFVNRGVWFADLSVMAGNRRFESFARYDIRGNWKSFRDTIDSGRGAILASAHLGNWHGGGVVIGRRGVRVRSVLYHNLAARSMDGLVARRGGVGHILVDGTPFSIMEIVRALRGGEVVAMLTDKPWDSRRLRVPFFGRPADFPVGPARIARLAEVPIFPAFCTWTRPRRYLATICDPIEVRGDDPDGAEREAMERIARTIEGFVASNLELWFNFSPVWGEEWGH